MPPRADSVWRVDPAQVRHLSDEALWDLLYEADRLNVQRARESSAAFVEYVLTHEQTGDQITNADFHREWHQR